MAEHDDEILDALRDANPIDAAAMPASTSPPARALFERITMTEPDVDEGAPHRSWIAVAAAAIAVLALTGGAVALQTKGDRAPTPRTDVAADSTTTSSADGPITPGGAASCVEVYTLETLANRDAAFDGTVEAVTGDVLTFRVHEWFRGGAGDSVTRRGATAIGGVTSAGPSLSLEPGTRLLVAGDDDFAWGCGFTQPYDAAVATGWRDALAG